MIQLYNLYLDKNCFDDDKFGLTPFYLLFHAWYELDEFGVNYYFEGANLSNIEDKAKEQPQIWIDKYMG